MNRDFTETGSVLTGEGEWTYRINTDWAKLPDGTDLANVADVAVDPEDNVYVFHRGEIPVIVLDRHGNLLRRWGREIFTNPHGIDFGHDGCVYCTDDRDHTVRKFSPEGELLMTLGVPHEPTPRLSNAPFNRCTHSVLASNGDILVSDGYGNARIHRFTPDGRLIGSWGDFGTDPGQFNLPHGLAIDENDRIYVADRENHRIQVFTGEGIFAEEWHHLHRPCSIHCRHHRNRLFFFVSEGATGLQVNVDYPNLGPRVSILDASGKAVARLGTSKLGVEPGDMLAPHGIAVDSHLDIYVAELGRMAWEVYHSNSPIPKMCCLKKLERRANA